MKRVVLVLVGVTAAGFLSVGLVRAADDAPELGESVVVSPSPVISIKGVRPFSAPARRAEPVKPPVRKAEPVKPPAPKPVGGDDDDDDGGGDDDD